MTKPTTMISVKNVTKRFGSLHAVDSVNFDVKQGEIIGFIGVNGAGKTTTINMIMGFISPSEGEIHLLNNKLKASNAHITHKRTGFATSDMSLPRNLTGKQYLDFILSQHNDDHSKQLKNLTKLFKPQLDKKIGDLSKGNRQKIALIAAFVAEPDLVILDEPTSGLDPIMQEVFLGLVKEERERGTTIFMSSHYLHEVAEVCTRVMLMKNGKIIKDLTSNQLNAVSGKSVKVLSKRKISTLPIHAKDSVYDESGDGHVVSFSYHGDIGPLQRWISVQHDLIDFEVTERTLESAFNNLYDDHKRTVL